jgi:hypothetical protein
VRRARTEIATGIKTATVTETATEMQAAHQARLHRVHQANMLTKTPAEDGAASETKDLVWAWSGRG